MSESIQKLSQKELDEVRDFLRTNPVNVDEVTGKAKPFNSESSPNNEQESLNEDVQVSDADMKVLVKMGQTIGNKFLEVKSFSAGGSTVRAKYNGRLILDYAGLKDLAKFRGFVSVTHEGQNITIITYDLQYPIK